MSDYVRDVVGRVHCRTGREPGVAGLGLWNWVRGLPLVAQIIVWVLFLPLHVGFATLRPNSPYRANFRYALLVRRNPPLFHRYRRR